eukprot:GFUD01006272.1.p1 GENE.GFUD01006272.1~~GFUD01006272.1.p1  ORF type:complete len:409 (+),score=66.61 GFUD01006272.1:56-1282(+)
MEHFCFFFIISKLYIGIQGNPLVAESGENNSIDEMMPSCLGDAAGDSSIFEQKTAPNNNDYELKIEKPKTFPYHFSSSLTKNDRATFIEATNQIENISCVNFVERTIEGVYFTVYRACSLSGNKITPSEDCMEYNAGENCCIGAAYVHEDNSLLAIGIGWDLNARSQASIGLIVHELLHVLNFNHTQKRNDREKYIRVIKDNIKTNKIVRHQYEKCDKCDVPSVSYDCMSIMHYRDWFFATKSQARIVYNNESFNTMVIDKDNTEECDLHKPNSILTESDIKMINQKYLCENTEGDGESCKNYFLMSIGFGSNIPYPPDQNQVYTLSDDCAEQLKITFLEFEVESSESGSCDYDWVKVLDQDGTILMGKTCGYDVPEEIISKTNKVDIQFVTDDVLSPRGWHLEYRGV